MISNRPPAPAAESGGGSGCAARPSFAIFIPTKNPGARIAGVLDRISEGVWECVEEVFLFDDCSQDGTPGAVEAFKAHRAEKKLSIHRSEFNLGHGGNLKRGFDYAVSKGYDYVILLAGDGQYPPESLEDFISAAREKRPAAVLGSRMLPGSRPLAGGMPLYKYLGNRILRLLFNTLLRSHLSEYHCGYRMYSVEALKKLNYAAYSDKMHFDTNIVVEMLHMRMDIAEIPIPSHHGKDLKFWDGFIYARDSALSVLQYLLGKAGIVRCDWAIHGEGPYKKYRQKVSPLSSHKKIVSLVPAGSRTLDLGSEGNYVDALVAKGCTVFGVNNWRPPDSLLEKYGGFIERDIDRWIPPEGLGASQFDCIILADVLEHLRTAPRILASAKQVLSEEGIAIASTGNIGNFYTRFGLLFGFFTYRERGILDGDHVHLYTRRSFRSLLKQQGYQITASDVTPIPFELLLGAGKLSRLFSSVAERGYYLLARLWPGMFAYQFILVARPEKK